MSAKIFLLVVLIFYSHVVVNQSTTYGADVVDAKHCISVGDYKSPYGDSNNSQTLENNCDKKIHVVWCHDNNEQKYKNSFCGKKGQYFQQNTVLKPTEVKNNQYTLPATGKIYYGACFGSYFSTETENHENGKYTCQ